MNSDIDTSLQTQIRFFQTLIRTFGTQIRTQHTQIRSHIITNNSPILAGTLRNYHFPRIRPGLGPAQLTFFPRIATTTAGPLNMSAGDAATPRVSLWTKMCLMATVRAIFCSKHACVARFCSNIVSLERHTDLLTATLSGRLLGRA